MSNTPEIELEMDTTPGAVVADQSDAGARFALLEMETSIAGEPMWLSRMRLDMERASSRAELTSIVMPTRARSDSDRALVRPLYDQHWDRLGLSIVRPAAAVEAVSAGEDFDDAPAAGSLESDIAAITAIATEASSNAAAPSLGSLAGGQLQIVGFSTAEGYINALRAGVPAATHAEYLSILGGRFSMPADAIAALNLPGPMVQTTAPIGKGITHEPTGKNYADMTREERHATGRLRVGASDAQLTGQALMRRGDIIAGAIAAGAGCEVGWQGAGSTTRGKLATALDKIGRADQAPPAKDHHAQLGRAVRSLQSARHEVDAVRSGIPEGIAARYVVTDRDTSPTGDEVVQTGQRASTTVDQVLVVDLVDDGTVRYYGDTMLADRVRSEYARATAAQEFKSSDLTAWVQDVLRREHGATAYGGHWYIPGGQRDAACTFLRAVKSTGWGKRWIIGVTITTEEAVIEGLAEGINDDVTALEREWNADREAARAAHLEIDSDGKPKRKSADITRRGAAGYLKRLGEIAEVVRGYSTTLGDAAMAPIRARVLELDGQIRPLVDDTAGRFAMLELS